MTSLSVVIVAQDEERTVGDVLKAVQPLSPEIIFVDSGSSDRTIEIAKAHGAKVYHQDWLGYAAQKNYAITLATCEWILSLDADEIVTPELVAEIQSTITGGAKNNFDGFRIPRLLYIGSQPVRHGGFFPDAQLRLFRRGSGRFNDRAVHEAIQLTGKEGRLKNMMLHYAYLDVADFEQAMEQYARLSVIEARKKGPGKMAINPLNHLLHPAWTFFYRYIVRGGILDGSIGLQLNLIYSNYVRKKIAYLKDASEAALNPGSITLK